MRKVTIKGWGIEIDVEKTFEDYNKLGHCLLSM